MSLQMVPGETSESEACGKQEQPGDACSGARPLLSDEGGGGGCLGPWPAPADPTPPPPPTPPHPPTPEK